MGITLDVEFPRLFTKFMMFANSIVNLEFLNLMPLGCVMKVDYHGSLLIYTLIPIGLGIFNYLIYWMLKRAQKVRASNAVYGWFLFMTFLILPSVSTKIFLTFSCTSFDGNYGRYLKSDYSIDCDSDEHKVYELYAYFCSAIFPFGVPCLYLVNLWQDRAQLDPGQSRMVKTLGEKKGLERALKERETFEVDKEHEHIKSLAFLYDVYEPRFYYFEVVETIRKLMLTGGLVLLGKLTTSRIVVSIFICLAAVRLYAVCKPYIKERVDLFSE